MMAGSPTVTHLKYHTSQTTNSVLYLQSSFNFCSSVLIFVNFFLYFQCSVPCGGGHQNVTYYCAFGNRVLDQIYCDLRSKPTSTTIPCNEHSCARWAATDTFYPCSVSCGEGVETRRYDFSLHNAKISVIVINLCI